MYCRDSDVEEGKKASVLLSLMGAKMYNLLRNVVSLDKLLSKIFKDIIAILQNQLSPKPLMIVKIFRFHKRNQTKVESISEYIAELHKLSH